MDEHERMARMLICRSPNPPENYYVDSYVGKQRWFLRRDGGWQTEDARDVGDEWPCWFDTYEAARAAFYTEQRRCQTVEDKDKAIDRLRAQRDYLRDRVRELEEDRGAATL